MTQLARTLAIVALFAAACAGPNDPAETANARAVPSPDFAPITPNGEIGIMIGDKPSGSLPAEYVKLDYPDMPWRGDPGIGITDDGVIYVALYSKIFVSKDGGRTWKTRPIDTSLLGGADTERVNYDSFAVLRDGTLLWAFVDPEEETDVVLRSADGGRSWQRWASIEDRSPFETAGGNQNCMTEMDDGTIVWPTRLGPTREHIEARMKAAAKEPWSGPPYWTTYVYRSRDGGKTWMQHHPLQEWGTETNLLQLESGRLLAAIRYQRPAAATPPANEPVELREADQDREWIGKRVFLADSDDSGRTWKGFRPVRQQAQSAMDVVFGEAHGHLVQLSDGRVILIHERRYPYENGDVRARVSHNEGQTWSPKTYRLSPGHGYAASVVLPDDTIVTALGNTPLNSKGRSVDGKWYAQVVRWRLPPEAAESGKDR
jgi:hypothetical protein